MEVRIIRSRKRRKTVQAREVEGTLEILAPAHLPKKDLEAHIAKLRERIERHKSRSELDDAALKRRACELSRRYFNGLVRWESIRWVTNQDKRHGSCTPAKGSIRISDRVAGMPRFVSDYVIVHELAHLIEPNHGPAFWELVYQYPRTERARGYLMAVGVEDIEG